MLRNEVELLDSFANKIANNVKDSKKNNVINEIISFVNSIKDPKNNNVVNELLSFVNNELEKADNIKIDNIPTYICEELLNTLGIEKGEVNVTTPDGKTTITFSKGETPEIKLFDAKGNEMKKCSCGEKEYCSNCEHKSSDDTKSCTHGSDVACDNCKCEKSNNSVKEDKCTDNKTDETSSINPTDDIIEKIHNEVFGNKTTKPMVEPINGLMDELEDDYKSVILHNAGGMKNVPFIEALRFICENNYFDTLVDLDGECDKELETYDTIVLLPNIWGKIYEDAAFLFSDLLENGKEIYIIDTTTFEINRIKEGYELFDYAMSKSQETYNY